MAEQSKIIGEKWNALSEEEKKNMDASLTDYIMSLDLATDPTLDLATGLTLGPATIPP